MKKYAVIAALLALLTALAACGVQTGYFDMVAYEKFHEGKMTDYIPTDADLQKGFDGIPRFPGNEL